MKRLLHVGCGNKTIDALPEIFKNYEEFRQDIDPIVKPDFCCSITNMLGIQDNNFDAIYSCHCLEHIHPFEVLAALKEMKRVLNDDGFVYIKVPDFEKVAELVLEGKINQVVYDSPAGPVTPLDIVYGYTRFTQVNQFMIHRCGFTLESLLSALSEAGFAQITGRRAEFDVEVIGTKSAKTILHTILERI